MSGRMIKTAIAALVCLGVSTTVASAGSVVAYTAPTAITVYPTDVATRAKSTRSEIAIPRMTSEYADPRIAQTKSVNGALFVAPYNVISQAEMGTMSDWFGEVTRFRGTDRLGPTMLNQAAGTDRLSPNVWTFFQAYEAGKLPKTLAYGITLGAGWDLESSQIEPGDFHFFKLNTMFQRGTDRI